MACGPELGGTGTIVGNIVNEQGFVWPGGTIYEDVWLGVLTVSGTFQQQADGALYIELGGPTVGECCALHLTGAAALNGELRMLTVSGFVPQPGQEFEVLTAASVTGEFSSVTGDERYCVAYEPTRVTVALAAAGDCDADCDVDADDMIWLLECVGGPEVAVSARCQCADADTDTDVDLADFAALQTRATAG